MYRNYLKIGWRHLLKDKGYALLNVFGLALGMTAAILLGLVVRYEHSFDTFHPEHERVYRLGAQKMQSGETSYSDATPAPVVPTLLEEVPEVEAGSRYFAPNQIRLRYRDRSAHPLVHLVDSGFVDLFDFGPARGDLARSLATPNVIVLTQSVAERLFGSAEAVGQTLEVVNDEQQFTVGAVLPDPPAHSSLQFEALMPWDNAPDWVSDNWYDTFMTSYVKLTPSADPLLLSDKLQAFKDHHYTSEEKTALRLYLRPLAQLRAFDANNRSLITLLSAIAVITLLIACVNFTNLAAAQSLLRVREIGVRRALGSLRSQLVGQFLSEVMLTTWLALVLSLLFTHLILPHFNRYFDLSLTFRYWQSGGLFASLVGLGLLMGLVSGVYPSLLALRLSLLGSLSGRSLRGAGGWTQQSLIVGQYVVSMLLMGGALVISRQVQFMKSHDLRFDQENVVAFSLWYDDYHFTSEEQASSAIGAMLQRLENESSIAALTLAEKMPGRYDQNYNTFYDSEAPTENPVSLRQLFVGNHFFETLGMKIVAGRLPTPALAPDSGLAVVINEAALAAFGWQDIEGKRLIAGGESTRFPVVGVVQDYHYQSLQERIQPVIHFYYPGEEYYYGHLAARLQPGRTAEGLAALEEAYQSLDPHEPFTYYFLDEEFNQMYQAQERLGLTATVFAGTAMALASLGLLALTSLATRRRRQEVGIRKVLGASVLQIVALLSRHFALLVAVAFLIACPLIYYASRQFLQDFAYRVAVGPDVFLVAGLIAFLVATVSVGFQALRAASVNPTHSLRDE